MPTWVSPLLRNWRLLEDEIVPALLGVPHPPKVWSIGDATDAIAIATAYCYREDGRSGRLRAYAGGVDQQPLPLVFTLSQIRAVPSRTRAAAFERRLDGWVPSTDIASRVLLGPPDVPVDMITAHGWDDMAGPVLDRLKVGGHLVLTCPEEQCSTKRMRGLRRTGESGLLYQRMGTKETSIVDSPAADGGNPGPHETLADKQAQSDLVHSHMNLARSLARRFAGHGENREDLDQVALLALVKAAMRFDDERNVSFSTFATSTILGELKRHFRDRAWMMRVPRPLQETYLAIKDARETLTHELSHSPTIAQIAERIGIDEERVLDAMEAGDNFWPESLSSSTGEEGTGRDIPVVDHGFELALEQYELSHLIPRLSHREQLLIKRLFLDGCTQRQVATELEVSQMQVSRLLNGALKKLRVWAC